MGKTRLDVLGWSKLNSKKLLIRDWMPALRIYLTQLDDDLHSESYFNV